jgi:ribonucleoside-diphosphate reductase alpha chain
MLDPLFTEPVAMQVWDARYRLCETGRAREPGIQASWDRVALALSAVETHHRDEWRSRFRNVLSGFRFLPGGRILAGAGAPGRATLFNCFVTGQLHDSLEGIFSTLSEAMITMQAGGGIGCDFSPLRPAGFMAQESGNVASGPVSFMHVWNEACAVLTSTAPRRGAMMATLRCDHPDIEAFIDAKKDGTALRNFNLAVLISDVFMTAVEQDAPWRLVFPIAGRPLPADAMVCDRKWSGSAAPEQCVVARIVSARALWERLQRAAFDYGDPGVIFIDRVERDNNLYYAESISATNPCGEVPLPPHGACNLGSINLTKFISDPFGAHPRLDLQAIAAAAAIATRLLDDVYQASPFPLKAQEKTARASRRIGIGITGLADAYAMLGIRYGSAASMELADKVMATICHAAYRTSIDMAAERGVFPQYRAADYLAAPFIQALPPDLVDGIRSKGIHNSHLTAIAPAGSISLLANNVSSGIEPIYAYHGQRHVRDARGTAQRVAVHDYAWKLFRELNGENTPLPDYFVEAHEVPAVAQLELQAVLQAHVDQAISKTINLSAAAQFEECQAIFTRAYQLGLKGCTMFRPEQGREGVLAAPGAYMADACP